MTHKHTEHRDDPDTDADGLDTHVAEMLASTADPTRLPETVPRGLLEDAIQVKELGVTTPADECADQATSLPSIPREQISIFQQKDATVARLKH